ncbi:MAG: hypothetical protein A2751_00250 [Candidatus Doudnabacteria bacterium RIFCSPHIGHO2_01_FULL_46_14]|uniref:3D domain-containing protein n=1 Tax=Candidatus Doudnabacteria bacterium RIFCSPHIGHO2_01_FULL_46_14 TaxID=1817824 RepID=A0A1F5NPB4_9BACT|nr:MAG: hypothetical protein A2751_00250 [Candidatus Doudnabacteria bacterium RIFCSPHIGHO2_01_FULL_46_14]
MKKQITFVLFVLFLVSGSAFAQLKRVSIYGNRNANPAAGVPMPPPATPPVKLAALEALAGKTVCQAGTTSLDEYERRYGNFRRGAYLHTGAVYASEDPRYEFGAVADVEMRFTLDKAGAFMATNQPCDFTLRGWYAVAAEEVEGGQYDGRILGSVVRSGADAACDFIPRDTCRIVRGGGRGAGAVIATTGSASQERYIAIELYQEVVDPWGRQVLMVRGTGSDFVKELESKQGLGIAKFRIEHNNAQTIAKDAVADIFGEGPSEATQLAEVNAEDNKGREAERREKIQERIAKRSKK